MKSIQKTNQKKAETET